MEQSKAEFIQKHKGQMRDYAKRFLSDLSDTGPYATDDDKAIAEELGISVRALRQDRADDDLQQVKCGTNIPEFWEMTKAVVGQLDVKGRSEIILWRDKQYNNVFAWDTSVFALPQIEARGEWQKCATFKLHSWHKEAKGWSDAWRGAVTDAMGWSWRAQTIWLCVGGVDVGTFRWTSTRDGSPRKTRGGRWVRVMKVTPHVFTR